MRCHSVVLTCCRQYPLIFGPWRQVCTMHASTPREGLNSPDVCHCWISRQRFDVEVSVFSKLSSAVADIIHRSPHTAFRKKSRRVLKVCIACPSGAVSHVDSYTICQALHNSEITANNASASSLETIWSDMAAERLSLTKDTCVVDAHPGVFDPVKYCDTLSWALERLYKTTQKSLRYKVNRFGRSNVFLNSDFKVGSPFGVPRRKDRGLRPCVVRMPRQLSGGPGHPHSRYRAGRSRPCRALVRRRCGDSW